MDMFVSRLVVLFWFREIRYGRGLSINGPEGKNIRTGMMVPIECHSDSYGIVFEFTHRIVTQSVPIAECEFKKDNSSTTHVTSTAGLTKLQSDSGRTGTLVGQILGVVAFMIFILCFLCMAYRKWRNTITQGETGDFTHDCDRFISQETGHEEIYNPPVLPGRIGVYYTEHEIIAESSNSSSEYIDWNCPDSIEMQEAHNNSEELNLGQSVDKSDTSSEHSIISLNDLCAGPNVSPVSDNMGTENVPSCDRKEDTLLKIISERVLLEITEVLSPK